METYEEFSFDPWLLRVTDLKQFDYCPRVVYYEYCRPGVRPTTYKMESGIAAQDRIEELEQRRSLRAYGTESGTRHFNVSVSSVKLGLSGQVDLVVEADGDEESPKRLIPVDFKQSRKKPPRHFKLQLACYALLLEESWLAPIEEGYIYLIPTKQSVRVPLTTRLRNDVHRHLKKIRTMIETEQMPPPTAQRSKCVNCEFRRFCNDVI